MTDAVEKTQFKVHLGTWTNWSRGPILGATLTLEPRYGLLLLSFTATFVAFVASRFWRIMSLALHRIYSTPEPRDALHHQRQVVLRNSVSAASTLWTTLQLAWCWRAIAKGYIARTLPIVIFAALGFCAFTVAGGFTSSISSGIGNEVLIDGSQCALLNSESVTNESLSVAYPFVAQSKKNAANYAQQCYSLNSTGTLECKTFVESRLRFTSTLNASCPFSGNVCRSNDSNLLLDSGLISSDDVGINLPLNQRMFYRQVLHCAPLRTDGFAVNVSTEYTNHTRYYYGGGTEYYMRHSNWTYEAETLDVKHQRLHHDQKVGGSAGFNLLSLKSVNLNETIWLQRSEFVPIPQLFIPDADLNLIFLSPDDNLFYFNPTNDPWYRGTLPLDQGFNTTSGPRTVYFSDEAASPMGCAERYQYCDSNKNCGSLTNFADALYSAMALYDINLRPDSGADANRGLAAEASRFQLFQASLASTGLQSLLTGLGPSSLLSLEHLFQGMMGPLPENQWQLDVTYWFEMILASLQATFVNTARGPTDEAVMPYVARPDNEYHWQICNNQKIRSTDYTSLSLFGLYFTYVTGILIVVASYTADPLIALLYSRRKYQEYKYLEWAANGTMQLQRLAYQGLGSEKWTNYTDDVPRTSPGLLNADLARAYPLAADNDEIQELKPKTHRASSTTAPSISSASTHQCDSGQHQGGPAPRTSVAPGPIPQGVQHTTWQAVPPSTQLVSPSPQATTSSLQAVLSNPQAVSPVSRTVSPSSQFRAV